MSGPLVSASIDGWVVPTTAPAEIRVAPNFEQFDGLMPLDKPTGKEPGTRPGQQQTPQDQQVYTRSAWDSLTNVLGGEPLPVADWHFKPPGGYTPAHPINVQFRSGVGQNYQGAAQTVALSEITSNPPVPGDITSIISGWG